jgi:hypothetical protein
MSHRLGFTKKQIDVVAQITRRSDGRYTFRVHDGRCYRGAKEFVKHDLGWSTECEAEVAARGCGFKHVVSLVEDWEKRA